MPTMTVSTDPTGFRLQFPYDPVLVDAVRALPSRRWDPASKCWTVPQSGAVALVQMLGRIQGDIEYAEGAREQLESVQAGRLAAMESSRQTDAAVEIPAPEGLSYLPYQRAGIAYAASRRGVLIADEMGLGKTIQAIGLANTDASLQSILIICPASLRLNWLREWCKWDVHGRQAGIANGKVPQTNVVIVNYDILKKHILELRARPWDLLIIDEAHYLKNHKAQRTQLVLGKKDRDASKAIPALTARRRVLLTGTPILNKPIEAWSLVSSFSPEEFPSWAQYAKRYCDGHQTQYGWDVMGASNLEELQDRLRSSIMVRRLKKEVLTELPPKRRQVLEISGEIASVEREQMAYACTQERLEALRAAVQLAKAESDEDYEKAVQALREGASAAFTEMAKLRHATALAKVPYVIEHLTDALEGGKVIAFAHHRDVIQQIVEAFPGCVSITGDTPMAARQAAVDRFQNDPTCNLIVGNLQAMGVGLTLTASAHVIFAELDWVPGVMSQAEDRAHRIGQINSVLIQHLVLEGSLDAVMAKRLVIKQEIIDRALDERERTEAGGEPILPTPAKEEAATESISRHQIVEQAVHVTGRQIDAVHLGLRMLAGMCDRAHSLDGAGFSRIDVRIGHSLASVNGLTARQAVLGQKLVRKYRRQLPAELVEAATAKDVG
jgi:superfamily II DNA or RNA helicase